MSFLTWLKAKMHFEKRPILKCTGTRDHGNGYAYVEDGEHFIDFKRGTEEDGLGGFHVCCSECGWKINIGKDKSIYRQGSKVQTHHGGVRGRT